MKSFVVIQKFMPEFRGELKSNVRASLVDARDESEVYDAFDDNGHSNVIVLTISEFLEVMKQALNNYEVIE